MAPVPAPRPVPAPSRPPNPSLHEEPGLDLGHVSAGAALVVFGAVALVGLAALFVILAVVTMVG